MGIAVIDSIAAAVAGPVFDMLSEQVKKEISAASSLTEDTQTPDRNTSICQPPPEYLAPDGSRFRSRYCAMMDYSGSTAKAVKLLGHLPPQPRQSPTLS